MDKYLDINENDLLLYSDDKENLSKALQKIDEISKFYNKSPCGDLLISFLNENNIKLNANSLITILPSRIKSKFDLAIALLILRKSNFIHLRKI